MLDPLGRKIKDGLLAPTGKFLGKIMGPNGWTTLSFLVGVGSALALIFLSLEWALGLWVLCRILDGVDGTVARATNRQSDFGGYLDLLVDFVIYSLIPLAFAYREGTIELWIATAVLLAVFYVNSASWMLLSVLGEKHRQANRGQTSMEIPTGIVGGTETVVFYTLFFLLPEYLFLLFLIMAGATLLGVPLRLFWAWRRYGKNSKPRLNHE